MCRQRLLLFLLLSSQLLLNTEGALKGKQLPYVTIFSQTGTTKADVVVEVVEQQSHDEEWMYIGNHPSVIQNDEIRHPLPRTSNELSETLSPQHGIPNWQHAGKGDKKSKGSKGAKGSKGGKQGKGKSSKVYNGKGKSRKGSKAHFVSGERTHEDNFVKKPHLEKGEPKLVKQDPSPTSVPIASPIAAPVIPSTNQPTLVSTTIRPTGSPSSGLTTPSPTLVVTTGSPTLGLTTTSTSRPTFSPTEVPTVPQVASSIPTTPLASSPSPTEAPTFDFDTLLDPLSAERTYTTRDDICPDRDLDDTMRASDSFFGPQPGCFVQDPDQFNLCLDIRSQSGDIEFWYQYLLDAKERWETVINGDHLAVERIVYPSLFGPIEIPVDDIIVVVFDDFIDGLGGTLAVTQAEEPDFEFLTPRAGVIIIDENDICDQEGEERLSNIFLHEMGRVLGLGVSWNANDLTDPDSASYTGEQAVSEWNAIGCTGPLPLEVDPESGETSTLWNRQCFNNELMTGVISSDMLLSKITIGSLEDLGYIVNYDASDPFDLSNLGECGASCPAAGNGRRLDAEKLSLSTGGRQNAVKSVVRLFENSPKLFRESDFVVVYKESGYLYDVQVSFSEVERFIDGLASG